MREARWLRLLQSSSFCWHENLSAFNFSADNGEKYLPDMVGGRNTEHSSFSKKILVEEDAVSGRYGVAASSIRVGDVIAVDAPYASVMNPEKFPTHCHHCYRMWALSFFFILLTSTNNILWPITQPIIITSPLTTESRRQAFRYIDWQRRISSPDK